MKVILKESSFYTLNFEPGDEVMDLLVAFAKDHKIRAAHLSGLGAARELDIAYYNLESKTYERTTITEDVEVLSLNGNIGIKKDNDTVLHLHGVFGRRDLSTFGGHIFRFVISGAGEIHMRAFEGEIRRKYDDKTGLTLMCPLENGA